MYQPAVLCLSAEFLDDVMIDACNKFSNLSYPVLPTLFLEFHGTEAGVKEQVQQAGRNLTSNVYTVLYYPHLFYIYITDLT